MGKIISKVMAHCSRFLYQRVILALSLLFCGGIIIILMSTAHLSSHLMELQAQESASLLAEVIGEARTLYSEEAVDPLEGISEVKVTARHLNHPGAIPLPATFLIDLGAKMSEKRPGVSIRLYSDYPFRNREEEGGPRDKFEEKALHYLRKHPERKFTRIQRQDGASYFRYAQADIMQPSCVDCHNSHPDSTKTDWQVGDVRGVLEITQPLDRVTQQSKEGLQQSSLVLVGLATLSITGISLVIGKLRRNSWELEQKVIARTAALRESNHNLEQEREKADRLLLNILPADIAEQLKDNPINIAQGFAEVTILFADICGFTRLSSSITPIELVQYLNQIFSTFDRLTEKYGLEKIKTIGDAYMVVGGLPVAHEDHALAIADMALEMQQVVKDLSFANEQSLQIRIGINTGSVVAGVIGIKKFSYDLWGDAVNVASRMESLGVPGKIQVSAATYEQLQGQYLLAERGEIEVKGKGKMATYWLIGKK